MFENEGITRKFSRFLFFFSEIPDDVAPFASGKFLESQTGIFGPIAGTPTLVGRFGNPWCNGAGKCRLKGLQNDLLTIYLEENMHGDTITENRQENPQIRWAQRRKFGSQNIRSFYAVLFQ